MLVNAEGNTVVERLKRDIGIVIQFDGVPKFGEDFGFVEIRRYGVCFDEMGEYGLRAFAKTRHKQRREG